MFAICVESSPSKGMGHLFRQLNFIDFLRDKNEECVVFLNDDAVAQQILNSKRIEFETVDLTDYESGWERNLIDKYRIDIWINDRLDTDSRHSRHVKERGVRLVTFDDRGSGVELSDLHVAALAFSSGHPKSAKKTVRGLEYLILSKDISQYRRQRNRKRKTLVTLGGSDTYGVTVKAATILKELGETADIHAGPSFRHYQALKGVIDERSFIRGSVPSLIEMFYGYDLAITGGGITPFEANASGLPCVIIANEVFEIPNGELLDKIGSSVFAGHHENINKEAFKRDLDIQKMSSLGMSYIPLNGAENIYGQIPI